MHIVKHIKNQGLDTIILWVMVVIYPLFVIPGPLPYFTGPRYYFLMFASLVAALWLIFKQASLKSRVTFSLAAFLLLGLAATLFSDNILFAWSGSPNRCTGFSTYLFCSVLFVTAWKNDKEEHILKAMLYTAGLVSLTAVLQHLGLNIVPREAFRENFHSFGTIGNPNFLGTYTVFILPAAIMYYLRSNKKVWLLIAALLFAALVASMTRGVWLPFGVIFPVLLYLNWKCFTLKGSLIKLCAVFAVVSVFIALTSEGMIQSRAATIPAEIESSLQLEDKAGSNRVYIWKETLRIISGNWAFGIGPDNLKIPTRPGYFADKAHNIYLEIAATMGLFALAAYLIFLCICLKKRRKDWLGTVMAAMIVSYLAQGFFNIDVVANLPLFWITLGLMQRETDAVALVSDSSRVANPQDIRKGLPPASIKRIVALASAGFFILLIFVLVLLLWPRQDTVRHVITFCSKQLLAPPVEQVNGNDISTFPIGQGFRIVLQAETVRRK